jgi:hypothetical protein
LSLIFRSLPTNKGIDINGKARSDRLVGGDAGESRFDTIAEIGGAVKWVWRRGGKEDIVK